MTALTITLTAKDGDVLDTIKILNGSRPDPNDLGDDNIYLEDSKEYILDAR